MRRPNVSAVAAVVVALAVGPASAQQVVYRHKIWGGLEVGGQTGTDDQQASLRWGTIHPNLSASGNVASVPASNAGWATAYSAQPLSGGKFYLEIDASSLGNKLFGFRTDTANLGANAGAYYPSSTTTPGMVLPGTPGTSNVNNRSTMACSFDGGFCPNGPWPVFTGPGTVMFAYDSAAQRIWVGMNGTWLVGGNPAAGTLPALVNTGSSLYLAVSMHQPQSGAEETVTIRQTPRYEVPAGFVFAGGR